MRYIPDFAYKSAEKNALDMKQKFAYRGQL